MKQRGLDRHYSAKRGMANNLDFKSGPAYVGCYCKTILPTEARRAWKSIRWVDNRAPVNY